MRAHKDMIDADPPRVDEVEDIGMRYWISALLLASAAAVPAYAQDAPPQGHHDGGGHEGGHGDGNHGGNNGGGDHQRGGPPPQAMQPRPQAPQAQARPAPQVRPVQQPNPAYQGNRGPGQFGHPQGNFAPGMGERPNIGQPGDQRGNGQRPDDGRGYTQRSSNGVRVWQGGDRGRPDQGHPDQWRPDGRGPGYDNRGGYQGRPQGRPGYDGRNSNGHNGGNWNRGWRDDHRYDWQGWRQTHREIYHNGYYRPPYRGWGYRRFDVGIAIDPVFFGEQYWINDPWYYRLPPAGGPYRWVRYYNDALLIDLDDGVVVDEIPDFFW